MVLTSYQLNSKIIRVIETALLDMSGMMFLSYVTGEIRFSEMLTQ